MRRVQSKSGRPVRYVGPGHVVMVDELDEEVSHRVDGHVFLVINAAQGEVDLLFKPEKPGNGETVLTVDRDALNAGWQVRDQDGVPLLDSRSADYRQRWSLPEGSGVALDFTESLAEIHLR